MFILRSFHDHKIDFYIIIIISVVGATDSAHLIWLLKEEETANPIEKPLNKSKLKVDRERGREITR